MTITVADLPAWVTWDDGSVRIGWALALSHDLILTSAVFTFREHGRLALSLEASLTDPPWWWTTEKHAEWAKRIPETHLPPAPVHKIQRGDLVQVVDGFLEGQRGTVIAVSATRAVAVPEGMMADGIPRVWLISGLTYIGPGDPEVLEAWGIEP